MWDRKDKITELPLGIKYFQNTKELNLTHTNVDMVPRGLSGVKVIKVVEVPKYIACDFDGDIYISKSSNNFEKVPSIEIYKAKFSYRQDPAFVESLRYVENSSTEIAVLPKNMRFFEKDGKTYLDLTKTTIMQCPKISGVDEVIMPRKGLFRCIGRHILCQPQKNYE